MHENGGCCGGSCGGNCDCHDNEAAKKVLIIDFLYLDLTKCERCKQTEINLEEAIEKVSFALYEAGYEIVLNKINIDSEKLAIEYKFISSPTIRVNGKDLFKEIAESECKDCCDLCGDTVTCRTWEYKGDEYDSPPVEHILNGILKSIYIEKEEEEEEEYKIPVNLKKYFAGVE